MNKKILISSLIISIVLIINAASPTIWGHNGWDVDNSSSGIVTENKHPQQIASYTNACPISLHAGMIQEDTWYEIASGGSGYDSKLWYKDRNNVWRQLSDDDGGNGLNFSAVVYFPAGSSESVEIAYGYYNYYDTYPYWSSIVAKQVDPNKDVPYLIVDPDGSLRVVK